MEQYQESFTEESLELIAELEKSLLSLENNPDNTNLIQEVFRAMHTLKGNSSMFGFKVIADFTHHLESIYEYVRSGQKKITKDVLDLTLAAVDHLSYLVKNTNSTEIAQNTIHTSLTAAVIKLAKSIETGFSKEYKTSDQTSAETSNNLTNYHIHFVPEKEIFYNGTNPLVLLNEIKLLGECTISADLTEVPLLEEIEATYCYTSWNINLYTEAGIEAIEGIFVFVVGKCKLEIKQVQQDNTIAVNTEVPFNVEEKSTDLIVSKSIAVTDTGKKNTISSIRVPSEKLDTLMSLVSELITLQAKLGVVADQCPHPELLGVSESLEKILTRLRDNAFSLCLLPIKTMLTPFNRLVRDLANELNKDIKFLTEGVETELDKNIMEGLSDPIMHLLRNSIDHGIENEKVRLELGKPKFGQIIFRAYCAGTHVYIEIQDDGKGMDPEKIRLKAIQKGLITIDQQLSEKELFNLIFFPGFSTAEQVSNISGRGVGMDVVKRKIEDIRGQIKISSQLNIGTTITIRLPITVSIIDGLLVKVGNAYFVIPLSAVERCFEAPAVRGVNYFNQVLILDNQQIPFINLTEEFNGIETNFVLQEIVLVYFEEKRIALIVDQILGKFQAVLKPLGKYFSQMENISGATILGDGNIALVLDTNKVAEQYLQKKKVAYAN
jgi:two-component system chemotaxis sensor kinase CheA